MLPLPVSLREFVENVEKYPIYSMSLMQMETILIVRELMHNGGNRRKAAEALGISKRGLRYKIREIEMMGIEIPFNYDKGGISTLIKEKK